MKLFSKASPDFRKLVDAIDERYRLYELLVSQGSEPHPPGLLTLLQEFKNLKIKAWDIEQGDHAARLIKELHEDDLKKQIGEEGDLR